jgi:hypothetical protein
VLFAFDGLSEAKNRPLGRAVALGRKSELRSIDRLKGRIVLISLPSRTCKGR